MWNVTSPTLEHGLDLSKFTIWPPDLMGALPDLVGPFVFIFEIRFLGPHWAFSHCDMETHDWATWQLTIGTHQPLGQSPSMSLATSTFHVTVRSATWLYGLPRGDCSLVHGLT
jgi:hypothetical protein